MRCEQGFIQPLREHNPPLLSPENRLNAFIAEVFSTIPQLLQGHERLLEKLLARQRFEWPLVSLSRCLFMRRLTGRSDDVGDGCTPGDLSRGSRSL